MNPSHSEIRSFMKEVTKSLQSFIDQKHETLSSFQQSLILMKVITYLHESCGYCNEKKFDESKKRLLHVIHQMKELLIMVNRSFSGKDINERNYYLYLDLYYSMNEIGSVHDWL